MESIYAAFIAILVFGAILISGCVQQTTSNEFSIGYHFTAEVSYFDAQINGSKLVYTFVYPEDIKDRCGQWTRQEPCWTQNDLKTGEARLTETEISGLVNTIREMKVMELDDYYGPENQAARCYPYILSIKLDSSEKQITYCSSPDGPSAPESFKKVGEMIKEIVSQKIL